MIAHGPSFGDGGMRAQAGAGRCGACPHVVAWVLLGLLARGPAVRADQQMPIPDITTLMRQVQAHQRDLDKTRESYTFRERQTVNELDKKGNTKKVERRESQVFYVNSHTIERLVGKDGHSLNSTDEARETERVKKEVEKAQQTPPGEMLHDTSQISVGRLLSIETFSNPRRLQMDQRSVLVFDFVGNNDAKTHGIAEAASKRLTGTIWIDERDRQVRRLEATLDDNLHLGFGMFSLAKGSNFSFEQKLVNGDLWLPTTATVHIEAHAIAFIGYRANVQIVDDDYQRFHTDAQQKDGMAAAH